MNSPRRTRSPAIEAPTAAVLETATARMLVAAALVALSLASAANASNPSPGGTLEGLWKAGAENPQPVSFSFHREELGEGRISVKLPGPDKSYVGQYLRLTGSRPLSRLRIFHSRWISDDFDEFRVGPSGAPFQRQTVTVEQFQRRYTGSVVATLIAGDGSSMRCVFTLVDAEAGLAGGATGRCQISDGGIIDLVPDSRQ